MKPPLGFIVLALVWAVPLTTYAIWHVRRAERRARCRIQMAVDQVGRDASAAGDVSPRVPDSRSHVLGIPQFRVRGAGASRLARLMTRSARTIQALVPVR